MRLKLVTCSLGAICILVLLGAAFILSFPDAYVQILSNRLATPTPSHLLGTDELGRDLFSRFVAGTKYTILTGLMTTLLAVASGWLMGRAACAVPPWFGRLVVILAYICFIAPSFLLSSPWPYRVLTAVLCALGILPLFALALIAVAIGNLTGWTASFAFGPLFGIGIAYAVYRVDRLHNSAWQPHSLRQLAALMTSVLVWGLYLHAMLDSLGLGVRPPEPSWGGMLVAQSASWWPNVIAGLGFLTIGITAFALGDMLSELEKRGSVFSAS